MPELHEDGDSRAIAAGDFRLVFRWTGARWAHRLELEGSDRRAARILADSYEGDAERDDPTRVVSPVYQQLQFQEDGRTVQALLVGQSGPHHFSAVFTVDRGGEGRDGASIEVDVADRCRGPVEFLASTYLVEAQSGELDDAGPSGVTWDLASGRLRFSPTVPARASLAEAGRRATQVQAVARPEARTSTHRLIYTWSWQPRAPQ